MRGTTEENSYRRVERAVNLREDEEVREVSWIMEDTPSKKDGVLWNIMKEWE